MLEEQFGVDAALLERAFGLAGDPAPSIAAAEITAYLETGASPRDAFAAIGSRQAYLEFQSDAGRATAEEVTEDRWRVRMSPQDSEDESAAVEETVTLEKEDHRLRVRRGERESAFEVSVRNGRTYLMRRLLLDGPRHDLLRNDSLRGRLAGSLAVDLLAWARRVGSSKV